MTTKTRGLGKNLSALLGNKATIHIVAQKNQAGLVTLPIQALLASKFQPRGDIDEVALQELAASIKQQGLLQPVIVRQMDNQQYEILAGERRWRASQLAGLTEIPVIIKEVDDQTALAIALVENLQREDLNAMDQARAMHRLTNEFALTHQQIADLLNKSRTAVSNFLRLMTLSAEVKRFLENGDLDMGHARALLILDVQQQSEVANLIVSKELSVRETEKLVNRMKKGLPLQTPKIIPKSIYQDQIQLLGQKLKTQIALKPRSGEKGQLVIHYESNQFLEKMLDQLSWWRME